MEGPRAKGPAANDESFPYSSVFYGAVSLTNLNKYK